jgi:hypothetical protein
MLGTTRGDSNLMVKLILIVFLFPAVFEITNLGLGLTLGFLLVLLPKSWQPIYSPVVLGITTAVSALCGFLAVRQFWPKATGKPEALASGTSANPS